MHTDSKGMTPVVVRAAVGHLWLDWLVFTGFLLMTQFMGGCTASLPAAPQTPANHQKDMGAAAQANAALDWIKVAKDKRGFVCAASGRAFVPWGFNYDRDYKFRLLEDYWEAEWPTVVEDFREMKQLGANVVRIHLQFARFMDAPDRPNARALECLGRLVKLAEETGLYLDLTGLACYRKKDVPAWYSALGEIARWQAQARFWEAVAKTCAGSPAVFCYDLMNEPIVPSGKRTPGDWLTGRTGWVHLLPIHLARSGWPLPVGDCAAMGRPACLGHPQARPAPPDHARPAALQSARLPMGLVLFSRNQCQQARLRLRAPLSEDRPIGGGPEDIEGLPDRQARGDRGNLPARLHRRRPRGVY